MRFQKFINEALTPSQFRMYVKGWNKEYLKDMFDGKYRIYLEMNRTAPENIPPSDVQKRVHRALSDEGFDIENYIAGLCKKRGDNKNLYKIGKVLGKFYISDAKIIQLFNNDPIRQANKKYSIMVVISRHPYDIAGMSTDRGWTSCMALPGDKERPEGGENCDYVEGEIKDGAIIAYLINKNDPNISKPIARMLIKSYYNEDDPSKKILVSSKIYGTDIPGFRETVDAWLDKQAKDVGLYSLGDNSYPDDGKNKVVIGKPEQLVELLKKRILQFGKPPFFDFDIFIDSQIIPILREIKLEVGESLKIKRLILLSGLEEFLHKHLKSNELNIREFSNCIRLMTAYTYTQYLNEPLQEWSIQNAFSLNVVKYIDSKMKQQAMRLDVFIQYLNNYDVSQQRKDELIKIFKQLYLGEK